MLTDEPVDPGRIPSLLNVGMPGERSGQVLRGRIEQLIVAATEVLRVDGIGLMLQDETGTLRVVGVTDRGAGVLEEAQIELRLGPCLDSFQRSETISVADLADAARYRPLWRKVSESGNRAVLSAPIRVRGAAVGSFEATLRHAHEWSPEEVRAIQAYAGILGLTLGLVAQATYWGDLSGWLRTRLTLATGVPTVGTDPGGLRA